MEFPIDVARLGYLGGALVFGAASAAAVRNLVLGRASRAWPVVKGEMQDSSITSSLLAPWRPNRITERVSYTYTVDGTTYAGKNLGYASDTMDENNLPYAGMVHVQRYRPGAVIDVHYDPRHPQRSVLEPGIKPSNVFMTALALAMAGVFVWLAAVGYKT
ncbi:MAG: DUF3592 domain-containing protein [Gemmatimonadaceae bacterium]